MWTWINNVFLIFFNFIWFSGLVWLHAGMGTWYQAKCKSLLFTIITINYLVETPICLHWNTRVKHLFCLEYMKLKTEAQSIMKIKTIKNITKKKNVDCKWYRDIFKSYKWMYTSKNVNIFFVVKASIILLYQISDKYLLFDCNSHLLLCPRYRVAVACDYIARIGVNIHRRQISEMPNWTKSIVLAEIFRVRL